MNIHNITLNYICIYIYIYIYTKYAYIQIHVCTHLPLCHDYCPLTNWDTGWCALVIFVGIKPPLLTYIYNIYIYIYIMGNYIKLQKFLT